MIIFEPIIVAWGFQKTRPGSHAFTLKSIASTILKLNFPLQGRVWGEKMRKLMY